MAITSANQLELLQTAEAVAREKMIDPDLVIQAMEESLARAAKSRYGSDLDIRVRIDRKTGRATFARIRTVVEDEAVENHHAQLTLKQAKAIKSDAALGDEIIDEGPPVVLGRSAAQGRAAFSSGEWLAWIALSRHFLARRLLPDPETNRQLR